MTALSSHAQAAPFRTALLMALAIGLGGLVATALGALADTRQFFISYLFGYFLWLGLALGCFTITMIHHLTGGRWGFAVRRFMEAGFSTLPLMAALFIPLCFGLHELYPWARASALAESEVLRERQPYMSEGPFLLRALLYFLIWLAVAWFLRRWSREQDRRAGAGPARRLIALSGPGLVLFPLTATFAYVDWIMSLEREWYSSIFPLIVLAGQALMACAFGILLLGLFTARTELTQALSQRHYHDLGNLMLAFVLFWTYAVFGQTLIIYSANLPEGISWYLHRIAGGWKWVIVALAAFHFFIPFVLLLFRALKQRPAMLSGIAALVCVAHTVAVYWMIVPSFHHTGIAASWMDFTALAGVGGIWMAAFLWFLKGAPLAPVNDPRWKEAMVHAG